MPSIGDEGRTIYEELQRHYAELQNVAEDDEVLITHYFRGGATVQVGTVRYLGANLFALLGRDEKGSPTSVVVHVSALELQFRLVKVKDEEERKKGKLGFEIYSGLDNLE